MDISFVNVAMVSPYLPLEALKLAVDTARPAVVTTNYSDTEIKLGEAEFFLHLLEQNSSYQSPRPCER